MTQLKANKISCCAPQAIKLPRIFISVSACIGCGLCGEVCPFGLPQPVNSGKYGIAHPELCTECSACFRNCPTQAIMMQEQKGCGCLWDARQRAKNPQQNSCCG
ncbi:MAG: 4Fe-4S dicluster domain-containing protein [Promethearchaeota archaeon]|nr:MAG: 4Fe-4S dicluster domain-containing protein [Candidatus Lokiarchaeota archaeon]